MTSLDIIVRAAPLTLLPFIVLRSRRFPAWRPVLAQTVAFSLVVAAEPYTLAHPRVSVITLALWPGVALAGAMAAMGGKTETLRKGGWARKPWLVSLICYAVAALACAALYTRAMWWIGSAIEVWLRVAVGPALVWVWSSRRRSCLVPAQVAALAPAVEVALAPLGPWARWLAGHAAVVEDWPLGLAGSAVAYAVVAIAIVVDVMRR